MLPACKPAFSCELFDTASFKSKSTVQLQSSRHKLHACGSMPWSPGLRFVKSWQATKPSTRISADRYAAYPRLLRSTSSTLKQIWPRGLHGRVGAGTNPGFVVQSAPCGTLVRSNARGRGPTNKLRSIEVANGWNHGSEEELFNAISADQKFIVANDMRWLPVSNYELHASDTAYLSCDSHS